MTERIHADIGYMVRTALKEGSHILVDVEVFGLFGFTDEQTAYFIKANVPASEPTENIAEAERFLNGTLKWDGCFDLSFDDNADRNTCLHFCGVADARNLGVLMERIYAQAKEELGQKANW